MNLLVMVLCITLVLCVLLLALAQPRNDKQTRYMTSILKSRR